LQTFSYHIGLCVKLDFEITGFSKYSTTCITPLIGHGQEEHNEKKKIGSGSQRHHNGSTELRARQCREKKSLGIPTESDAFAHGGPVLCFGLPLCSSSGAAGTGNRSNAVDTIAASMDAARLTLRGIGQGGCGS
jgi:hypothetical protein